MCVCVCLPTTQSQFTGENAHSLKNLYMRCFKPTRTHKEHCPPPLLRAEQVLSSFNVSSSIDLLLKPLPWVGIGQIQSHTGQFITEPQTFSLTVSEGRGEREGGEVDRGREGNGRKERGRKKSKGRSSVTEKHKRREITRLLFLCNRMSS